MFLGQTPWTNLGLSKPSKYQNIQSIENITVMTFGICNLRNFKIFIFCKRLLPRLPFQLVSLRSSVIGELLSPRLCESRPEPPEPVLEMDIRDLEGLMADGASDLMGSFLERWWRTLIMASFSMIWAWRFFILDGRGAGCNLVTAGQSETKPAWMRSLFVSIKQSFSVVLYFMFTLILKQAELS